MHPDNPQNSDNTDHDDPRSREDTGLSDESSDVGIEDALIGERERRRRSLLRSRRRMQFARAALVGVLAGAVAVLFQLALYAVEDARAHTLELLKNYPQWGWAVWPIVGGLAGAIAGLMTFHLSPEAAGGGVAHVKGVLLQLRPLNWKRLLPVKFISSIIAIGGGLSLGREGPTVQMGAAVGQAVSSLLKIPQRAHSQLVACGGGAGLAAAFNAPLAGFIFVIEELQRELSPITYGTALVSTVCAVVVSRSFTGQLPSFHITGYPMPPLEALPLFAILGVVGGLMGVLYTRSIIFCIRFAKYRSGLPPWARPAVVGAAIGVVAWFLPEAIGSGHTTAESVLRGDYATPAFIGFVFILFATKFILTVTSAGSGAPGGIFAPMLVLGALMGLLVGQISALWMPSVAQTPAAFAVVGMAAFFSAAVRAPLTGIVLIIEMTANYEQLFPLLIACMTAYLVAEHFSDKPVYEAILEEDLHQTSTRPRQLAEPLLMDVVVEHDSPMDGKLVRDLGLPEGCLLVTVKRGTKEIVPSGQTRLRPGDQLTVIIAGDPAVIMPQLESSARAEK